MKEKWKKFKGTLTVADAVFDHRWPFFSFGEIDSISMQSELVGNLQVVSSIAH